MPTTCEAENASCGTLPDGCGGTLECGGCGLGHSCTENVCVCVPRTCGDVGATCGQLADGCGGYLSCGSCPNGSNCSQNQCVQLTCPGMYTCCDGSCSTVKGCPGIACDPRPDGGTQSS
ncbi:hypothetical protein [Pyxidicoccus xibeiensis]|uniref:hypothetical protein n=1 Tax=Pyxidicoccus xibeiensis TaxID=2906759 RepID=UPI0020A80397|nr:hypothetical protein [Pyxidicoccus xibeiensis]MCP3142493.1 hypothetical protein [Pyxidicoccus xibeiensis]